MRKTLLTLTLSLLTTCFGCDSQDPRLGTWVQTGSQYWHKPSNSLLQGSYKPTTEYPLRLVLTETHAVFVGTSIPAYSITYLDSAMIGRGGLTHLCVLSGDSLIFDIQGVMTGITDQYQVLIMHKP